MINDIFNPGNADYADRIVSSTIGLLSSSTYENTLELEKLIKVYLSEILSEVSLFLTRSRFMMHNISEIKEEDHAEKIYSGVLDIKHQSTNVMDISKLRDITSSLEENLESTKEKIENLYGISQDTISIYSVDPVENGINYTFLKANSPMILKYYEGKLILKKVMGLGSKFASDKKILEDSIESKENTFLHKISRMIEVNTKEIQDRLAIKDTMFDFLDITWSATITYVYYDLGTSDNLDVFLSRPYNKIKSDILTAIKNNL